MSDEDLFAQAMGVVKPLNKEGKIQAQYKKKKYDILRGLEGREASYQHAQHRQNLSPTLIEPYLLRAAGVSSKDIKKLAQTNIQHKLDLHGMTQNQAEKALETFFNQAVSEEVRYLSIVHGKGNHSNGKTVLKDLTFQWLEHSTFASYILIATLSTQSGGGASNILLRKQK